MSHESLSLEALKRALSLRDLTDPRQGPHAMQVILREIEDALRREWGCAVNTIRACPLVWARDNYDELGYPPEGAARDARYTRYVSEEVVLRTQTSAMIPPSLRTLAGIEADVLLMCPGLVYRRDAIDRLHVGEPHQVDLWRIGLGSRADLQRMIALVVEAALPGVRWRVQEAKHPYTQDGLQIDVDAGEWIEIGECGLADAGLLKRCGVGAPGLAMGLGLDRLLMLRKGIDDIRLLRSDDPRVVAQMLDLAPYRTVSRHPPIARDLSIAVHADLDLELLGDRARTALGDDATRIEALSIVSETPYDELPEQARARIGMSAHHKNLLVRIVLRDATRSMTHPEANFLRDRVYAALHEGAVHQWASSK